MRRTPISACLAVVIFALLPVAAAHAVVPVTLSLSPVADTREVGSTLTATTTVSDGTGLPVAGAVIDVHVIGGANVTVDLDRNPTTPGGYVGRCTSDADGRCMTRYAGLNAGTDFLQAFFDVDGDVVLDPGEIQVTVSIAWVESGKGTTRVRLDMHGCNGDLIAPITESGWTAAATSTVVGPTAATEVCATRFNLADELSPGPVVFTIAGGPGRFTDPAGVADYGISVAVDVTGGYNSIYLGSTRVGTTTVTAAAAGFFATGTKPWTAAEARSITLSVPAAAPTGTTHHASATVRDRFGNGVPGVVVVFTEAGTGRFFPDGGQTYQNVSDDGGIATAPIATNAGETGVQTVTATLSPFTSDCDLKAGDPPGAPAGVCSAQDSIAWGVTAAALTVNATPTIGVWGALFRIEGALSAAGLPVGGRTVTLTRATGGGFSPFQSVVTDSFGRFTVFDRASRNTVYRAAYAGDAAYSAAAPATTAIGVRPGIVLNASAPRVARGRAVVLSGRVSPAHPGTLATLQTLTAKGWRPVAALKLDPSSSFAFRVIRASAASVLYRVVFASDAHHLWNISANRRVSWT